MEIEILKWENYNPKRDQRSYTWFRFTNDFFFDPKLFGITNNERIILLFLLCLASKGNKSKITIDHEFIQHSANVKKVEIDNFFKKMEEKGIISVKSTVSCTRQQNVVDATPTNERTNDTNDTNERTDTSSQRKTRCGAIPEFNDNLFIEMLSNVKQSTQELWLKTYDNDHEWITQEFLKAVNWLEINPARRPKSSYMKFLGSWLARGWERHRKTIPAAAMVDNKKLYRVISGGTELLNDAEKELIAKYGGARALGNMTDFEVRRILKL